ncbi:MAG: alpha/beta hydrolase [Cellvibrio sp.]|uniref:alpha/beta fold hydrolase n=1 Tax=Cellvibrio sp. TaxID=1965322 RepID=UPI0031A3BAF3
MPVSNTTPLVLIPGFMLDESLWDEFIELLPAGREIHRANLRVGQSISQIAEHIAQGAPKQFVLVGFSLGGYIARSLVEQFPDRVAALILIASSLRSDTPEQKKLKEAAVKASSQSRFKGLSTLAITKSLHPDSAGDKVLINRIRNMGIQLGYEEFSKQSMLGRDSLAQHPIQCPTLVIAAAQDQLRSLEESYELSNAIPESQIEIIEGTGHMIPLEQPEVMTKVIVDWLGMIRLN